jgi:hypothetical protein
MVEQIKQDAQQHITKTYSSVQAKTKETQSYRKTSKTIAKKFTVFFSPCSQKLENFT